MTLIVLSVVLLVVLQFALWAIIKRVRAGDDGGQSALVRQAARKETALWLVAACVIVVLLALLARDIYYGQRTQRENSRRGTSSAESSIG